MFRLKTYTIIALCILCLSVVAKDTTDLWKNYRNSKTIKEKVSLLLSIHKLYKAEDKNGLADSIISLAAGHAQISGNDTLLANVYKTFIYSGYDDVEAATEYARDFLAIADRSHNNEWLYYANAALADVMNKSGQTDSAIERISKAYYYANQCNNDTLKIDCFLIWGECLENTNNKLDAFRHYLDALNIAQKQQNKEAIYQCYSKLSFFYFLIGNNERAKEYTIKQVGLIADGAIRADSLTIMNLLNDLSLKYYYNKERINGEKMTQQVTSYAIRHNKPNLLHDALDYYKKYLIENGLITELADVYTVQFPSELKMISQKDTSAYFWIMAFVSEARGKNDSARYYYEKCIHINSLANKPIQLSNNYKRYGQFLLRSGNALLARQQFDSAFSYAKNREYLPYLIETSHYLDSLYHTEGNISKAYEYSKLNKEYSDKQEIATKQDAILLMEIDNETRQREIAAEQEIKKTEHRHNVQYTAIIFTIISAFIILIMMGVFKVSKVLIRSLGFISFIFFFEFIILLLDHKIMEITHHEPWKMLAIKVVIISMLLPLHHWLEHKVTHYLIEHHIVDANWLSSKMFWKKKSFPVVKEAESKKSE